MTIHSYISITHTDIGTYTGLNAVTAVILPLNHPHSSPPQMSSESASHTLYCAEDAADLDSSDSDTCIPHHHDHPPPPFTSSSPHSPPSDEGAAVAELIDSEARHMPEPDYLRRCRNVTARQDSVNWILKVHARHRFSPATAFLSVNYFDRFLSFCSLPKPNGWPFQLLSVACLSLAAKMEEPRVPLLLDLQMCDPKYVFEPKTVQRMELWVMSNLDWRLRSVTPFDFLHFFISKLPSSSSSSSLDHHSLSRIFSASSDLVLSTTRVTDFLLFTPSTMAAAAVLCATREISDCQWRLCHDATTSFHERVNKEMVRSCQQLMEEHLLDTCPASRRKERRPEPVAPPSPVAVLDAAACVSCDTRSETPGSTTTTTTTGNKAEAAPPKRPRTSAPDVQQR